MPAFFALKRDAAGGIDGETWKHYGEALEDEQDLSASRMDSGRRAALIRHLTGVAVRQRGAVAGDGDRKGMVVGPAGPQPVRGTKKAAWLRTCPGWIRHDVQRRGIAGQPAPVQAQPLRMEVVVANGSSAPPNLLAYTSGTFPTSGCVRRGRHAARKRNQPTAAAASRRTTATEAAHGSHQLGVAGGSPLGSPPLWPLSTPQAFHGSISSPL